MTINTRFDPGQKVFILVKDRIYTKQFSTICPRCNGDKRVWSEESVIDCKKCSGSGVYPGGQYEGAKFKYVETTVICNKIYEDSIIAVLDYMVSDRAWGNMVKAEINENEIYLTQEEASRAVEAANMSDDHHYKEEFARQRGVLS